MRILVTGGAGFIGSNFIRYILNKYLDYKIVNLDKLTYAGNLENLKDIEKNKNYQFVKGDICDEKIVNKLAKNADCIVNFAAESVSNNTYLSVWCMGKIKIVTLEELFNKLSKDKRNKIIKQGKVEVINLNNTNYKALSYKGGIGYWMPINQISRHRYKGKLIKLSQKWGEIEVTPNHSIYDSDFNLTTPTGNPELLGLRNINHISKKNKYLNFHGEQLFALLRIFAAYITEGWTSFNKKNGSYHFGISNKDRKWILKLKCDLELLGFNPSITKTKDGLFQLIVSNKSLFNFVRKEAGFGSHNKCIPSFVFQLKPEFQEKFFKTMVFGNGEIIKNKSYNTLRYTTTSQKLAVGFSLLLTLLKYNYSVSTDERFGAYTFRIGGDFTISLLSKKYKEINYNNYVYDISVATLENFACGVGNIVVHNTHVDRSILGPESFIKTDVYGTYVLLEVTKETIASKFKIKKYVQISTDEVYGSIEDGSFSEESPLKSNSPYAASKASADLLVLSYFTTYHLPVVIVRSSNNFGPYQHPEKIIPLFITNALENKPLPLYGNGKNVRDWLYVLDNCRAIDLILHQGKEGEIYNVGGGNELTNFELTNEIIKILSDEDRLITQSLNRLITFISDRPGHDRRYSLDCTKIKKELNWRPIYSFEKALKDTVKWYKTNPAWWKKIKEKQKEYQEFYKKQYGETM